MAISFNSSSLISAELFEGEALFVTLNKAAAAFSEIDRSKLKKYVDFLCTPTLRRVIEHMSGLPLQEVDDLHEIAQFLCQNKVKDQELRDFTANVLANFPSLKKDFGYLLSITRELPPAVWSYAKSKGGYQNCVSGNELEFLWIFDSSLYENSDCRERAVTAYHSFRKAFPLLPVKAYYDLVDFYQLFDLILEHVPGSVVCSDESNVHTFLTKLSELDNLEKIKALTRLQRQLKICPDKRMFTLFPKVCEVQGLKVKLNYNEYCLISACNELFIKE